MDARRFRTEPWMASTKIPTETPVAGLPCSGRPFLLGDLFLWASKEKVTRPRQRTKIGAFATDCKTRGCKSPSTSAKQKRAPEGALKVHPSRANSTAQRRQCAIERLARPHRLRDLCQIGVVVAADVDRVSLHRNQLGEDRLLVVGQR